MTAPPNPARLAPHDPRWELDAVLRLDRLRTALLDLPGAGTASFDHIGSTAVPGLPAKPFVDLQVRIAPLPSEEDLARRLRPLGYERALGSRPDSPGVYRDLPRGDEEVPADVWEKRLFMGEAVVGGADVGGAVPAILHVRRADSPWGRYTVWFRDWLRAHPERRDEYARIKQKLSAANAGKPDYDDYTRAKTDFFDEVRNKFSRWATGADGGGS